MYILYQCENLDCFRQTHGQKISPLDKIPHSGQQGTNQFSTTRKKSVATKNRGSFSVKTDLNGSKVLSNISFYVWYFLSGENFTQANKYGPAIIHLNNGKYVAAKKNDFFKI